ncbi:MAG TPA: EF-P lysine aminoacylase GenX [Desulfobacterales bacterium]|nr:EF-P lysine aminoacylase GenX [Desulfobacterales bacterium]
MGRGGRLRLRHRLLAATREFFDLQGFVEVETPLLAPTAIPEEHILPVPCAGGFLQSSPEQYMKRLLASGEKRIYQICKSFRSGERGRLHLPEFTILEWYRAGDDYHQLMDDCVALLRHLAKRLDLPSPFTCRGQPIELNGAWQRLSVADAFTRYAGLEAEEALAANRFEEILSQRVEPHLGSGRPLFLHDYPAALASLARRRPDAPHLAERFELYIAGIELANGFSELADPEEQRARFAKAQRALTAQGVDPGPMPERFLDALADMGPAAGVALGLDRLLLVLFDLPTLDATVAFPPAQM